MEGTEEETGLFGHEDLRIEGDAGVTPDMLRRLALVAILIGGAHLLARWYLGPPKKREEAPLLHPSLTTPIERVSAQSSNVQQMGAGAALRKR
jgi:hypothetical protein